MRLDINSSSGRHVEICLIIPWGHVDTNPPLFRNISKSRLLIRLNVNLQTDYASKTNYPSGNTSFIRATRRIKRRQIMPHYSWFACDVMAAMLVEL